MITYVLCQNEKNIFYFIISFLYFSFKRKSNFYLILTLGKANIYFIYLFILFKERKTNRLRGGDVGGRSFCLAPWGPWDAAAAAVTVACRGAAAPRGCPRRRRPRPRERHERQEQQKPNRAAPCPRHSTKKQETK